jgi:hypothetical protein
MASELIVQTLKGPTSGANANKVIIPSGQTLTAPGHVIQVQHSQYTATTSSSSDTYVDIPNLSVTITPASTSSKIFIAAHFTVGGSGSLSTILRILRNNSSFLEGDSIGNRQASQIVIHSTGLSDSPSSTDALTYKAQYHSQNANTSSINRNTNFANDANEYNAVFTSTITVMEIA